MSKIIQAAVFCARCTFAMLDAEQRSRSELSQRRRERTIAVAMDPAMHSVRKEQ